MFFPAVSSRGSKGYTFAELVLVQGPQVIGDTAQNTYQDLAGRGWLMVLDRSRELRLYKDVDGLWEQVTAGLPPLFGETHLSARRRFTAAFDQSARIIVAYEQEEVIRVTRWEGSAYVQNVTFDGVDPQLMLDAVLADPRGYPNAIDDGWSLREAYYAGIPVLFEWLAGDPVVWLESAIPDSDIVLFYLDASRLHLMARVQRQLYATPILIHTFEQPVILDRVVALAGKYQLLLSDEAGDPLPEMLISDPYLGDFIINPEAADTLAAAASPIDAVASAEIYPVEDEDALTAGAAPLPPVAVGDTAFVISDDAASGSAEPLSFRRTATTAR